MSALPRPRCTVMLVKLAYLIEPPTKLTAVEKAHRDVVISKCVSGWTGAALAALRMLASVNLLIVCMGVRKLAVEGRRCWVRGVRFLAGKTTLRAVSTRGDDEDLRK